MIDLNTVENDIKKAKRPWSIFRFLTFSFILIPIILLLINPFMHIYGYGLFPTNGFISNALVICSFIGAFYFAKKMNQHHDIVGKLISDWNKYKYASKEDEKIPVDRNTKINEVLNDNS